LLYILGNLLNLQGIKCVAQAWLRPDEFRTALN
jgi:hypothetical protein